MAPGKKRASSVCDPAALVWCSAADWRPASPHHGPSRQSGAAFCDLWDSTASRGSGPPTTRSRPGFVSDPTSPVLPAAVPQPQSGLMTSRGDHRVRGQRFVEMMSKRRKTRPLPSRMNERQPTPFLSPFGCSAIPMTCSSQALFRCAGHLCPSVSTWFCSALLTPPPPPSPSLPCLRNLVRKATRGTHIC